MTFEEFERMMGRKPAQIIAKDDGKNNTSIQMEGRGLELLALSLATSESIISKLHLTVDDYCKILKDGCKMHPTMSNESESKENKEIKKVVSKLLEDLFR